MAEQIPAEDRQAIKAEAIREYEWGTGCVTTKLLRGCMEFGYTLAQSRSEAEITRLQADRDRLDWLAAQECINVDCTPPCVWEIELPRRRIIEGKTLREVLDRAMGAIGGDGRSPSE